MEHASASSPLRASAEKPRFPVVLWNWAVAHPVATTFLVAATVRCALVALSSSFEDFALDDSTYDQLATDMATGYIYTWDDFTYSLYWRTAAFLGPITLIYKLVGPVMWAGQLWVALIGAAAAALVAYLALEYLQPRWALAAGGVVALFPSQAFWSSQLMKDAAVWAVLAALAVAVAIALRNKGRALVRPFVAIAVLLCIMAFLREHTLVVAAWAVVVACVFAGPRSARWSRVGASLALAILIPWFVAAVGPGGWALVANAGSLEEIRFRMAQGARTAIVDTTPGGTDVELNAIVAQQQELNEEIVKLESQVAAAEDFSPARLARLRRELDILRGRAAALLEEQQRIQSLPGATFSDNGAVAPNFRHIPRGLVLMLLEPLPLPFTGSTPLRLARLETILWYPLLALAGVGLWHVREQLRVLLFPVVMGGGILLMYALSEGNVGTAHRHRGEFVWIVVLLAAHGASRLLDDRTEAV